MSDKICTALYHFHYTLHTVEPGITIVSSLRFFHFFSQSFHHNQSQQVCILVCFSLLLPSCIFAFPCMPYISWSKSRGKTACLLSQDIKTSVLHFCMCLSKRGVVSLYVSPSKADRARKICVNSSATAVQSFKDPVILFLLWGFHNAKGIRR